MVAHGILCKNSVLKVSEVAYVNEYVEKNRVYGEPSRGNFVNCFTEILSVFGQNTSDSMSQSRM